MNLEIIKELGYHVEKITDKLFVVTIFSDLTNEERKKNIVEYFKKEYGKDEIGFVFNFRPEIASPKEEKQLSFYEKLIKYFNRRSRRRVTQLIKKINENKKEGKKY